MAASTSTLVARRMRSLRLGTHARGATVLETVRWMGALQAQDYESGLWAVGARTAGVTRAEVESALARREIVRTWPMRGTWHLIPAADAAWMQDLCAARVLPAIRRRSVDFGFDDASISRCRKLVLKALEGGRSLPRESLVRRITTSRLAADGQAANHLLRRFGNEGLLCNGLPAGKEPTFTLRDEWIRTPAKPDRDAALAELALRYFRSHGPATLRDFVWWTGLTVTDARRAVAANGVALRKTAIEGNTHWHTEEATVPGVPGVELLPAFDEHLLGYQDRDAVLDEHRAESVCPGGNGVFRPTLVVKGRVAGIWRKRETLKKASVDVTPYEPLSPAARREVEYAGQRFGEFLSKPVTVTFA